MEGGHTHTHTHTHTYLRPPLPTHPDQYLYPPPPHTHTGYSIFVIEGTLPSCEADELLTLIPVEAPPTRRQHRGKKSLSPDQQYDADLAAAVSASLGGVKGQESEDESYDMDLATAISMSMQGGASVGVS